jgi:hypothetical protein
MKNAHEEALLRAYPLSLRKLSPRMPGGECFECECVWRDILAELFAALEALAREQQRLGTTPLAVTQVKEKMGALRVYFEHRLPAEADAWLLHASERSRLTCERCGAPGVMRGGPRPWQVMCDRCDAEPAPTSRR